MSARFFLNVKVVSAVIVLAATYIHKKENVPASLTGNSVSASDTCPPSTPVRD